MRFFNAQLFGRRRVDGQGRFIFFRSSKDPAPRLSWFSKRIVEVVLVFDLRWEIDRDRIWVDVLVFPLLIWCWVAEVGLEWRGSSWWSWFDVLFWVRSWRLVFLLIDLSVHFFVLQEQGTWFWDESCYRFVDLQFWVVVFLWVYLVDEGGLVMRMIEGVLLSYYWWWRDRGVVWWVVFDFIWYRYVN